MVLTTTQKRQILRQAAFFASTPEGDLAVLAEMTRVERLRAGEILFAQGAVSDQVYVVAEGVMDIQSASSGRIVRSLGPGELLGEYGLFSSNLRTMTVIAQSDAVLLSLDYARFSAYLIQFPGSALALLKVTVGRLVSVEAQLADIQKGMS